MPVAVAGEPRLEEDVDEYEFHVFFHVCLYYIYIYMHACACSRVHVDPQVSAYIYSRYMRLCTPMCV